ncbi:hypothetical protein BN946_scf184970.g138 [Trametes cinnabarina]|uniref:Uncharacterized protein n=1 Tax=Pycnoporus cinnabarinus TaxID=5643 RepID=A0A060SDM8_PYCCI|nr:hypothetical protein BN946_scf184970.g138 [Trametes cinnabarina]
MDGNPSLLRLLALEANDPSIQYNNYWNDTLTQGVPTKSTYSPNANATLSFNGIMVVVFGWVGPAGPPNPSVNCYVDGNMTSTRGASTLPGIDQYQDWTQAAVCFQDGLADGNHTLELIVTEATKEYPFMLDMVMFRISTQQYQNLASDRATTNSSSGADPASTSSTSSKSHSVLPAVIGGIIGVALCLLLTTFGVFMVLRRRRHAYSQLHEHGMFMYKR